MVQLGFYFHMQQALGGSRIALTWPLVFAVCFMLVFSIVIALFKDIPDVKGDSQVCIYQPCSPVVCHSRILTPMVSLQQSQSSSLRMSMNAGQDQHLNNFLWSLLFVCGLLLLCSYAPRLLLQHLHAVMLPAL